MQAFKRGFGWLFGNSARTFATLSVVLLILLAVVPAKDHFSEWRIWQARYRSISSKSGPDGIQQIWIPELNVTDRCTTCHVAVDEPPISGALQPFHPHPAIPHSTAQFGCTICHGGQGRATTSEEAHRGTVAWDEPVLPARYTESACGGCHEDSLIGTPRLNAGRKLLSQLGCVNCHRLTLPGGTQVTGSDRPPSLKRIAEKTTREWIYSWIMNPASYSPSTTMPNFGLTEAEAKDISAFIIAQSTPAPVDERPQTDKSRDQEAGFTLYRESFCESCHSMQSASGKVTRGGLGPDLTGVGSKVRPGWLRQWLLNPGSYLPDTAMPRYRFTEQQVATLGTFLQARTKPEFGAGVHLSPATAGEIENGRKLVIERGCGECHEINGIARAGSFAPDLSAVGSLPAARILTGPGVARTIEGYLTAKIKTPKLFGPTMKMPRNELTDAQVEALVVALLSGTNRARSLPASVRRTRPIPLTAELPGRAGILIREMRCLSCHTVNGRGGDLAPDLSYEGSAVQREWLTGFLNNPNTIRPVLTRRMPRFNLSNKEISTIADFLLTAAQTPAFAADESLSMTPQEAARGKTLFYDRYACNSCHVLDPKRDSGYIGPTLTDAGSRLTAAWIFHWLGNAQSLRPGSLEPNWNMDTDDARALTAFLMQQKSKGGTH